MRLTTFAAIALVGLSVAACNTNGGGATPATAAGVGATSTTGTGVVAGGLIGNSIGTAVDSESRQRGMLAEYQALQSGPADVPVVWRDPDENIYGEVVPGEAYQRGGVECRDYTHTIYTDGRPEIGRATACRQPGGAWQTVS